MVSQYERQVIRRFGLILTVESGGKEPLQSLAHLLVKLAAIRAEQTLINRLLGKNMLEGVFQVGLAYVLLVRAIERVPAVRASLLLMVEPALSPVIAYLAHGEALRPTAIAGGALIVGAVLVGSLLAGPRATAPADDTRG